MFIVGEKLWASFFQVFQHSAKNRWASFFLLSQLSQLPQHSAKNRLGTNICSKCWKSCESWKNDAQRFFAECWGSWKNDAQRFFAECWGS